MTAATPPPPRDGEVQIMCTCGARGRNPHPWEPGEWCPIRRPDESVPSEPPAGELLHRICQDAVITYQVAMVGPRMVSGLPEYPYMPSDERTRWQENVLAIAAGTFTPRATCTPEQLRAWEAVSARVREMLAPELPAEDSPTPGTETCGDRPDLGVISAVVCQLGRGHGGQHYWENENARWRWPAAPSPVDTTEPPAEAQQGDELRGELARWLAWGYGGDEYADQAGNREHWQEMADLVLALPAMRRMRSAALAARPSADEVKLRRLQTQVEAVVVGIEVGAMAPSTAVLRLRAALDGTR